MFARTTSVVAVALLSLSSLSLAVADVSYGLVAACESNSSHGLDIGCEATETLVSIRSSSSPSPSSGVEVKRKGLMRMTTASSSASMGTALAGQWSEDTCVCVGLLAVLAVLLSLLSCAYTPLEPKGKSSGTTIAAQRVSGVAPVVPAPVQQALRDPISAELLICVESQDISGALGLLLSLSSLSSSPLSLLRLQHYSLHLLHLLSPSPSLNRPQCHALLSLCTSGRVPTSGQVVSEGDGELRQVVKELLAQGHANGIASTVVHMLAGVVRRESSEGSEGGEELVMWAVDELLAQGYRLEPAAVEAVLVVLADRRCWAAVDRVFKMVLKELPVDSPRSPSRRVQRVVPLTLVSIAIGISGCGQRGDVLGALSAVELALEKSRIEGDAKSAGLSSVFTAAVVACARNLRLVHVRKLTSRALLAPHALGPSGRLSPSASAAVRLALDQVEWSACGMPADAWLDWFVQVGDAQVVRQLSLP